MSRGKVIDRNLRDFLASQEARPAGPPGAPVRDGAELTGRGLLQILEAQFQARQLDLVARRLKATGEGFYTIGSAGHEGNAAMAAATRPTDPAFLHYRSGAFFARRAQQVAGQTPIFDVALSLCAARDDPISGGRHKVFGSRDLWIPPQTSTIASHLPKAMGAAFAIDRARYLKLPLEIPHDAIVICSFGDASLNHSTALGALNSAMWAAHQHLPMPVLWVCEDNGLGISVNTPTGWVRSVWSRQRNMPYFTADGTDAVAAYETAREAVQLVRRRRTPVFLHLELVRILGHAGTDPELAYQTIERIKSAEGQDPLLSSCRSAIEAGVARPEQLLRMYEEMGARVEAAAREAATREHHQTASSIVAPLMPAPPEAASEAARTRATHPRRLDHWGSEAELPENREPETLAKLINWTLHDSALAFPEMLVFGEDVARRGGVYGVTSGLWRKLGGGRVFNTLLDEQSILGLAIGAAHLGFLPVPEIQYLAYIHNAIDQIRGEASTLQFFSDGQFSNPMVVRVASFGYQRGFGGHFHNDNAIGPLLDIPSVIVAAPSRGEDAVGMLRASLGAARSAGQVVLFLEPIALYMTRDLHEDGDGAWRDRYPDADHLVPPGCARVYGDASEPDLTIVSWGNGLWRALRAARRLQAERGVQARTVDLRWLKPLDRATLLAEARLSGRVLVVDEGRRTGGLSEAIFTLLVEEADAEGPPAMARVCGEDSFVPLGPAWDHVLPSESDIVDGALQLLERERRGVGAGQ